MSPFAARLVNPPGGDPGLIVRIRHAGEALLFDLGSLEPLRPRELLDVSHAFVSHTHLDHFIGFDRLLRVRLAHERRLELWGPPGIAENVRGKLAGYTWNLVEAYPLVLTVHEVGHACIRSERLSARSAFQSEPLEVRPFTGELVRGAEYAVRAVHLDHRIPSLAFALEEETRLNVRPERLAELELEPGPWLQRLKRAVREGQPGETPIPVPHRSRRAGESRSFPLAELRARLLLERRGEKLAYVVDARFSPENARRIRSLAAGADVLFCEAYFLDADRERALARHHLTARQAGTLARAAGVARLVPFHHSARYGDDPTPLQEEARRVFEGALPPDEPA